MNIFQFILRKNNFFIFLFFLSFFLNPFSAKAQRSVPVLKYIVSMNNPVTHRFNITLYGQGWDLDTINFKMPEWMPGYYQMMNYAANVENFSAKSNTGKNIPVKKINKNTWQMVTVKNKPFKIAYNIKADKQFVANPYLDSSHAYLIPNGMFMYITDHLNTPVSLKINSLNQWSTIATGLKTIPGKTNEFIAGNFDILYDCPLLIGNLEELPSFKVNGITHRFIGYNIENFDKLTFMNNLKKVVEAAVSIIGDIPYHQYTFIGIGPGQGGIEHLNNTTISFDGKGLNTENGMNQTMSFLAHEYFHNYNVKRIRPFELGPFDYDKEIRTNLLWISEGLSVYYEYLIVKRAGLINEQTLLNNFESSINAFENSPGKLYQSLVQASYETWSDGPFGKGEGKSISYYDKGPIVGLFLDLEIRNSTKNKKSLDDVFRMLYSKYYKKLQRGFTDAEFQEACESIAGKSLTPIFEYVHTTRELAYNTFLSYAGLNIKIETDLKDGVKKYTIDKLKNSSTEQQAILKSWLGE